MMDPEWQADSIQESSDTNYCLRWNDFKLNSTSNLKYRFRELRDDSEFYDVTLCLFDGKLRAHKVILAACSTAFRNQLSAQKNPQNPFPNPFLYLKGIWLERMKAFLQFMYTGEVHLSEESLKCFWPHAQGQIISKQNCDVLNFPKKQRN